MKAYILIIIVLLSFSTLAQNNYGNEWIKPNQQYLKIKINERGVYKITYSQLQASGFMTTNISPKGFQIFYLGEEIPLHVEGESDNSFDAADFIEFYAEPNNGKADEILYKAGEQPNQQISLFTDEAVFFLTNNNANIGKRYENVVLNANGLTPETHIKFTVSSNFSNEYYPGAYVLDVMTFSDYIEGEGFLGNTFGIGGSQTKTLSTPNYFSGATNFKPIFESFVAGRSNASSTNSMGNNHHLRITVGGIIAKDTIYRGYKTIRVNQNINNNILNATTEVVFSSVNDLGALTDFQAPGYVRITYPRNLEGSSFNSLQFKLNSATGQSLLNFTNTTNWSDAYILDPISLKRYKSIKTGSTNSFTVNNNSNTHFVYSSDALKSVTLENVAFNLVDASTFNAKMLMVTHGSLINAVNDLATYKNSKGVSSLVLKMDDLYNQFFYGIHHPLAIRNLSRYLLEKATNKPEYLFLIGKGYEISKQMIAQDLVPTMGFPPSDNEFTAKIIDNTLAPALATGRLPAKTIEDVNKYLEKLRLFEQQPNEIWRKTIINITGGGNSSEDNSFANYLRNLSNISDKEFFGSSTTSYYKSVTDPITNNLTDKINKTIEDGANLVTFLGHGSTTGTAVSVGKAADIQRILFFFINGCSTGNAFTTASLGEDFILEKQRGAIGWIGTSSEGVASYLYGLANNLYQNSFKTNYGKSVASNISRSIRTYQNQNDALNKIHCQQYIYLGDPSLSFYAPEKPDYQITSSDVSILESNVTANTSSFNLSLIVRNSGKAVLNPVKISVVRTLNDNSIITYPVQSFNNLFNTDTLNFSINNDVLNASGTNKFLIKIDPENEIEELNKLNNTIEFSYFFASNGISLISPNPYSILTNNNLELKIQSNNLFTQKVNYLFEIDTVKTFDSNWKKESGIINAGLFANWRPNIVLEHNKIYYWRAKLDADVNSGGQWQNNSFTFIPNSEEGWNQGHREQFSDISLKNIKPDFNFVSNIYPIQVKNRGQQSSSIIERRIRLGSANGSAAFNGSEFEGFGIIAIDPINYNKRYNYPSVYNFKNNGVDGTGMFFFNTNNPSELDSLVNYINNIPKDFNVIGLSGLNFNPQNFNETALDAFRSLGLTVLETVTNGEPYVFVSKKDAIPIENYTKEIKALSTEEITFLHDLNYPFGSGTYVSEKIGPASNWNSASIKFNSTNSDILTTSIIGVNNNGAESVLKSSSGFDFDLTDINANNYPYLKIKTDIKDDTNFTAPTLKSWKVLYTGYAETSFNPEFKNSFYAEEIPEGDSLKIAIGVSNIKQLTSDSLQLNYKITKQDRTTINGTVAHFAGLAGNTNLESDFKLPSLGLSGNNVLQLSLNPKNNKDQFTFNNFLSYNFKVVKDDKNPLLDLLFDGKHIVNGEIVSPKPTITVSVSDENKFLLIRDTTAIKVYLKKSEDNNYQRLSFNSNKIALQTVATSENNKVIFLVQPDLLEDGTYTLKISSSDNTGNTSTSDYTIDFEVVNQQTVSNFLPYPNPVTTSTRFVFQLTGEKVPDKIKIQIMSASGKIVKEINKEELGNIRIGNNLTDYAWDGTDTFGDRLANGVYFYKVTIQNNDGSTVNNSYNATNSMFKNNIGKIYLLK
ncbi:C25 family cysteine peptidase [Pedobacter alpinus]|uniref:C25 family cysteine peptidase n=1 Tax=Pedobacter alpinus TaxID=1590643 RepID=A0ABW5TV46_9SPHI